MSTLTLSTGYLVDNDICHSDTQAAGVTAYVQANAPPGITINVVSGYAPPEDHTALEDVLAAAFEANPYTWVGLSPQEQAKLDRVEACDVEEATDG